jgi:ribulose-phosphate 3-epimerase
MTVFPGFGGQEFISDVLEKVEIARREIERNNLPLDLEVDGGIDVDTAPRAVRAGANVLVAGSAIFGQPEPLASAAAIRAAAYEGLQ